MTSRFAPFGGGRMRLNLTGEYSISAERKRKRQAFEDTPDVPASSTTREPSVPQQEPHPEEDQASSHDYWHSEDNIQSSEDTVLELVRDNGTVDDPEHHELLLAGDRFWFEDGNVILVAGDTQFRVYQGLLAAHSPVLAHTFSSSSPPANCEAAQPDQDDKCLVVHLNDSPLDLRCILRLFMPGALMPAEPTFELVSACIRLGLKYEIRQIYDAALAILKSRFTDNFEHWESLGNRARLCQTDFDNIHAIGAVNLVRLIGDSTMLPVALWQCCRLGSALVHGFTREDGTRENLTLEDLGLCFAAQERLIKAGVRARLRIFSPTISEKCQSAAKCKEAFAKTLRSLEKKTDVIAGTDPFVPYTRICLEGVLGLCSTCSSEVKARDKKERRAVWNRLPALMGIDVPGWGKTLAAKAE